MGMNADLGARLLAAGLVTREELGLALASVPAHGGALAAELVRQGVEEEAIAGFFVADGFGPVVGAAELEEARGDDRVPAQLAVDLLVLPLRQSASGLLVAMADPSDVHAVRELTHVAGVAILPMVARIGALVRVLSRRFPGEMREAARRRAEDPTPIDLVRRRDSSEPPGESIEASFDSIVPLTRVSAPASAPLFAPVPAEMRQDAPRKRRETADFVRETPATGKRRDTARFHEEQSTPRRKRKRKDTAGFDAPEEVGRRRRDTEDFVAAAPEAETDIEAGGEEYAPRDTLPDAMGRQTIEDVGALVGGEPDSGGGGWGDISAPSPAENIARRAARAQSILPQRLPSVSTAPPLPSQVSSFDPGHLSEVLATIRAARTRDDVCLHACRGLAPLGRCAVFLVLSKGILKGREISGGDLPRDAILNLWIPSTSRSLLARVLETKEPYLGPHGDSSADAVFRAALGSRGGDVLLVPVVLSGRTVAVLALDEPVADAVVLLERAEVLSRATADALRRLIVATKP